MRRKPRERGNCWSQNSHSAGSRDDNSLMDTTDHSLESLFWQLGLPSTKSDIELFLAQHRPLSNEVRLADAPFWTHGQAQFLREEINEDADWAEMVDRLDVLLRE